MIGPGDVYVTLVYVLDHGSCTLDIYRVDEVPSTTLMLSLRHLQRVNTPVIL